MSSISPIDLIAASLSYLTDAQRRVAEDIQLSGSNGSSGHRVSFENFIEEYSAARNDGIAHRTSVTSAITDAQWATQTTSISEDALVAEAQRYQLKYQALADILSRSFRLQQLAITGRG